MTDTVLTSFRFKVKINHSEIGFKSVGGLKTAAAFEPLAVGGRNGAPVMLPVPAKQPGKLTMEKGVCPSVFPFNAGERLTDMEIEVLDENGKAVLTYKVASPILESVETSKLDAKDSAVLIKTFTVLHSGIT